MDKLQHMLVMNMLFLVNATLENDTNTQIKRLVVHAYSLEKFVMLLFDITHKDPYIHNFILDMV